MARSPKAPGETRGFLPIGISIVLSISLLSTAFAGEQADIDALISCKSIEVDEKRLDCYDQAMKKSGDLPREPSREIKQTTRPSLFGRDDSTAKDALIDELGIEDIDSISSTVATVMTSAHGKVVVTLANQQTWRQVDNARLPLSEGDTVIVRRASFGSYKLEKASGSRSIRVKRIDG